MFKFLVVMAVLFVSIGHASEEHTFHYETQEYLLVDDYMTTFKYEFFAFLILHKESQKYMVYFIDYFHISEIDFDKIIKDRKPEELELAQEMFPEYCLNESNYIQ